MALEAQVMVVREHPSPAAFYCARSEHGFTKMIVYPMTSNSTTGLMIYAIA
jgi:hypothetical protein